MRAALLILAVLAAGLAVGYVALGRSNDPLDDIEPVPPATESGTAAHFAVERDRRRPEPPDLGRHRARRRRALGARAARPRRAHRRRPPRGRCSTSRDQVRSAPSRACSASPSTPTSPPTAALYLHWTDQRGRHARRRVPSAPRRRDRPASRCASCSSSTSPRRTTTAASSPFGPDGRLYLGPRRRRRRVRPRRGAPRTPTTCSARSSPRDVDARPARTGRSSLSGLRNPWRFSFDPALGELWIGDVGQDEIEEVNRVLLEPDEPPKNLGWSAYEGTRKVCAADRARRARARSSGPSPPTRHDDGCSVTGGHRLRRARSSPRLSGRYVYGDFCSGALWTLQPAPEGGAEDVRRERGAGPAAHARSAPTATASCVFASGTGALYRAVPDRVGLRRRLGGQRGHRPVDPHAHAVARVPGREAEPAAAQPQPARAARGARAGRGRRTSARRTRASTPSRAAARVADRHRLRPDDDLDRRRCRSGSTGKRPELALDDAVPAVPGQHVRLAEELGDPARRRAARRPPRACRPARRGPSRITTTASASDSASAWSWVTSSALAPAARRIAATSSRSASRSPASSAANGSSSSTTSGSAASARASATRWRSPPESSCG